MTRAKLEELLEPLIDRCKKSVDQAFKDSKLSPKDLNKVILVGGPTRMPMVLRKVEQWVGKIVERGIDPMECVAMGAAVQGGVLAGEVKDILLLDVTPLSLGIETLGGVLTKLIERNTTIPTKKSQVFSTAADSQTSVTIRVFQGERAMAQDNKLLGQFDLVGIPAAPRGIPQIDVAFDLDANGILNISAKDMGTQKEQTMRISAPNKLNDEEVKKMRQQAEDFADIDKKKREEIETINEADTLAYTTEKSLKDMEGKVDAKDLEDIKSKIADLKKLLTAEHKDIPAMQSAIESLSQSAQAAATKMYQAAGAAGAGGKAGAAGGKENHDHGHKHSDKEFDAEVVDDKAEHGGSAGHKKKK